MPLAHWMCGRINTALGCEHQPICMPKLQPLCSAALVPMCYPEGRKARKPSGKPCMYSRWNQILAPTWSGLELGPSKDSPEYQLLYYRCTLEICNACTLNSSEIAVWTAIQWVPHGTRVGPTCYTGGSHEGPMYIWPSQWVPPGIQVGSIKTSIWVPVNIHMDWYGSYHFEYGKCWFLRARRSRRRHTSLFYMEVK